MAKSYLSEIHLYHEIKKYLAHKDVILLDTTRCASCAGIPDFILLSPLRLWFLEIKKQSDWKNSESQYYFQWSLADYFQKHEFKEVIFQFLVIDNAVPVNNDSEVWYYEYPIRKSEIERSEQDDDFGINIQIDETHNFRKTTLKKYMEYLCGEKNI